MSDSHSSGRTRGTGHDVGLAAGVSQSTVSLVLSDKWRGRVSEQTATEVLRVAKELGYRPNLNARGLRMGTTGTVLMVIPVLINPYFERYSDWITSRVGRTQAQ